MDPEHLDADPDVGDAEDTSEEEYYTDEDWEEAMRKTRQYMATGYDSDDFYWGTGWGGHGRRTPSPVKPSTCEEKPSTCEEPTESGKEVDRCVYCCAKATLTCHRCEDEFYCSYDHLEEHEDDHKWVCVRKVYRASTSSSGAGSAKEPDDGAPAISQDSPLLCLPAEVLLAICRYLPGMDLVRLGWVCSSLRALCREPQSWSHVKFPGAATVDGQGRQKKGRRPNRFGLLRIAPALHTLVVSSDWPPVNLLRCTNNVQVFEFQWYEDLWEGDKNRLFHTIAHYRYHLKVVKLSMLLERRTFLLIDGLEKIRELYIGPGLVKAYPGSDKKVTSLELGWFVSGRVAAEILRANRDTLTSFVVDDENGDNEWLDDSPKSPVRRALKECKNLQEVRTLTGNPWPREQAAHWW